ncbi:unnamed protein product [Arctogadus glacialis]
MGKRDIRSNDREESREGTIKRLVSSRVQHMRVSVCEPGGVASRSRVSPPSGSNPLHQDPPPHARRTDYHAAARAGSPPSSPCI